MTIYRGVGGVNREIKQQFRGVGGVNREIKEQYRGVGGVNRRVFSNSLSLPLVYDAGKENTAQLGGLKDITKISIIPVQPMVKNSDHIYLASTAGTKSGFQTVLATTPAVAGSYTKIKVTYEVLAVASEGACVLANSLKSDLLMEEQIQEFPTTLGMKTMTQYSVRFDLKMYFGFWVRDGAVVKVHKVELS